MVDQAGDTIYLKKMLNYFFVDKKEKFPRKILLEGFGVTLRKPLEEKDEFSLTNYGEYDSEED